MRLLVISSVIHYQWQGGLSAYGAYVREIDVWAELFSTVTIAAPVRCERPPDDAWSFDAKNISILPQLEAGGHTWKAKTDLLVKLPRMVMALGTAIRQHDAVHVRCPGNLGLLGSVLAPLLCRRIIAKYAGQWNGFPGEPVSVRFQRAVLGSRYWKGPVTVYGQWPKQRPHIISFFTSIMTESQIRRGIASALRKRGGSIVKILFIGRLSAAKNVDILLEALAGLRANGHQFACTIVGEGPERERLGDIAAQLGISNAVRFSGGVPYEQVLDTLEQSDVLVLPSETEGWPKAIAEAMAFGLVCIGTDRGFVPEMLAGGRGIIVPVRDTVRLTEALTRIAANPEEFEQMRRQASEWARQYSLEGLRDALEQLLLTKWRVPAGSLRGRFIATSAEST